MSLPVDIDDIVLTALTGDGAPGCAVAVTLGDTSWVGAYGLARTEPALPFLPDTRIPVASMSKPFTATAVMTLVENGQVALDVPVRSYLPDFRVADPDASEQVTVRHLLTHRTGWLGDEADQIGDRGDGALAAQVANFGSLPQVLPAGTTFSYCNTGLDVAGRLVEVLSGDTYESYVEKNILAPLELAHSTFFAERVVSAPAASGHRRDPDDSWQPVQDAWLLHRSANPSGGLISTAGDQLRWLRWWLGLLDGGVAGPLRPETREQMISELTPVTARAATGLGWHVDHLRRSSTADDVEVDAVYHEGSLHGTATVCRFVPDAGLAVVVLTNADDGQHVYRAVSDRLLAELADIQQPERNPDTEVDETTLAAYTGAYRTPGWRGSADGIDVVIDGGTLRLTVTIVHFDQPLSMRAGRVDGDDFALIDGPWRGEPATFLRASSGELGGLRVAGRFFPREVGAG